MFTLFGKILQIDESINIEGTGLGLYVSKNITQALGGSITVDSEEGVYTRFSLTLPVR